MSADLPSTSVRSALCWIALAVGVSVATVTTSGPQPWGATAVSVIAIVVAFVCALSKARAAPFVACVTLGVAAGQDLLSPGIALGHDLHAHGWGVYTLWNALVDGGAWPRWDPYLGLGMPLLQLYAPLGFVACWPFQAVGFSTIDAMKAALLLAHVASAGAAWWAAGRLGGSRNASALAAAVYSFAPYHLLDLNVRLAWGELFAFPAMPLVFAAVARRDLRATALSGAWLILAHVLTAVILAPMLAILALIAVYRGGPDLARPRSPTTGRGNPRPLALGAALALGLTAWFWLPFVVERGATSLEDVAGAAPSTVAAAGFEAVERVSWSGYRVRARIEDGELSGRASGSAETMPLYAGAVMVALLIAALGPRASRGWAAAAIGLFTLGVYPVATIVDLVPGWNRMQFAFRLWGPATALASLAIGLGFGGPLSPHSPDRRGQDDHARGQSRAFLLAAMLALAWDAGPWLVAPIRIPPTLGLSSWSREVPTPVDLPEAAIVRVEGAMFPPGRTDRRVARVGVVYPEFLTPPLRALIGRPPGRAVSEALGVSLRLPWGGPTSTLTPGPYVHERVGTAWRGVDLAVDRRPGALVVTSDGTARTIRLVEAWFTGWRVRFDAGPWTDADQSDGLLMVDIPAGASRVELGFSAWYPWDRAVGNVVSIVTLLIFAVWRPR